MPGLWKLQQVLRLGAYAGSSVVPLSHNLNELGFGVDRGRVLGSAKLNLQDLRSSPTFFSLIKSPHGRVRLEHVI
jgi:hypothetical protein